ncbi:MAG: DEAD/DEAH box helicase [Candidatus Bathyarchaeia archaeon]
MDNTFQVKQSAGVIRVINDRAYFYSHYDESLISVFKEAGLRWDPVRRAWFFDLVRLSSAEEFRERLASVFERYPADEVTLALYGVRQYLEGRARIIELSRKEHSDFDVPVPSGLSLYPYQKAGVEFLVSRRNVLLADSMGLGKTVQVIGFLNWVYRTAGRILRTLVICPSSVKYNWQKEISRWSVADPRVLVLEGRNGTAGEADIWICNYDILQGKRFPDLDCIVLDEAHYIKNLDAIRTKEVRRICSENPHAKIIALTGTPMLNRPVELFPILNLLLPERFSNFFSFAMRYCAAHRKQIQTREGVREFWDFSGASNTEELGRILRATVMLRRERSQVLKDLPERIRTVIPVRKKTGRAFLSLEERAEQVIERIREINAEIRKARKAGDLVLLRKLGLQRMEMRSVALPVINEYRRAAFEEKKDIICEFVEDVLESEPVLLFVHHRDAVSFFTERFSHFTPLTVTGETPAMERAKRVEAFQNGYSPLFIATILAAGEGITLTRASTVVFAEYEWTPAKMIQAESRAHRMGQKNTVMSYWFALEGSIDQMFIAKILEKLDVEQRIIQDEDPEEIFLAV